MKKIRYGFVLLLMVGFFSCGQGMNSTPQPDNPATEENTKIDVSYSTYKHYVDEGVLGEGVSYDVWKTLVEESYELEKKLFNSDEFDKVYSSEDGISTEDFTLKSGDVLITNGTSSAGFLGHAGIATSDTTVLHISGAKNEPPKTITFSDWHSTYSYKNEKSWTEVYRRKDRKIAYDAATWAVSTYAYSNAKYEITPDLKSTDVTYCSKIVWQAYYFGPSSHEADETISGIVTPRELSSTIHKLNLKKTFRK